jgi:hypothetical protein
MNIEEMKKEYLYVFLTLKRNLVYRYKIVLQKKSEKLT